MPVFIPEETREYIALLESIIACVDPDNLPESGEVGERAGTVEALWKRLHKRYFPSNY